MSEDEARVERVARAICRQGAIAEFTASDLEAFVDDAWRLDAPLARAAIAAATAQDTGQSPTLWGQIADIYGNLDDEDCAWIDREWIKFRGMEIRSTLSQGAPSPRTVVVGRVTGKLRDGDQARGMPHAICHACGLGYKCGDADCPNDKPNPMFEIGRN